ncbi:MAG: hypothetical protein WBX18_15340, partial [Terracidiphilus sp.]
MSTLAVRPALPQDEIFLYELYSAVRAPEFALAPITPSQRESLIRMQFRAQLSSYTAMFPNSCYHVVLLDSKPVDISRQQGRQPLHQHRYASYADGAG